MQLLRNAVRCWQGGASALAAQARAYQWNTRTGQKTHSKTSAGIISRRTGGGAWPGLRKRQQAYICRICSQYKLPYNYCRRQECRDERP